MSIAAPDTAAAGLRMTAAAARRINAIAAGAPPGRMLRVTVEGGGCSGFQYKFELVGEAASEDLIVEREGARLVIDPVSLGYLAGAELDFVDDLIGASFKLKNPNAQSSCGCGTSFSI